MLAANATSSSPTITGRISTSSLDAGRQQGRVADAAIGLAEGALQQARLDEAVDQLGEAAAGDDQRLGQVPHPHPLLRRLGDGGEDLVPGQRRHVGLGKGVLETLTDRGVGARERAPGLAVGESAPGTPCPRRVGLQSRSLALASMPSSQMTLVVTIVVDDKHFC